MNVDGTNTMRLTNNSAVDIYAHWSPDCQKIAFCSNRDGNFEIYSMTADGSNPMRLTNNASNDWTPKWSPNGQKIVFVSERDGNREIYVMNPDGSNQKRITNHFAMDIEPDWSHDGSKMIFVSDRNGNQDIYIALLSEESDIIQCIQITNDPSSDRHPVWQPRKNPTLVKESGHLFNSLPEEFELFQNYPNPFNSSTTIRYHLSQPGKLKLHIFDTLGRLVHTLIDHQQPAGDYQISWDGTDINGLQVSTGVYLCQLTADRYSFTNKLILIK
jgi:Tol biopolymer transport system component